MDHMESRPVKKWFGIAPRAIIAGIIVLFVFVIVGWSVANFNSLVSMGAQKDKSWAEVETKYQQRNDVITSILGSVKGAQKNEQKFVDIAQARSGIKPIDPNTTTDEKAAIATQNEATVVSIVPKLQEAYPDLKSDGQVSKLIANLEKIEGEIASSRSSYNSTVTNYNVGISSLPKSFFANMFGYKKANLYKADAASSKAPKVEF